MFEPTQSVKDYIYYFQFEHRNRDKDMYTPNDKHKQLALIGCVQDLSPKYQDRLEDSWAGTFYHEFFRRINEDLLSILYSDKPSRPNMPANVLVGLEVLTSNGCTS